MAVNIRKSNLIFKTIVLLLVISDSFMVANGSFKIEPVLIVSAFMALILALLDHLESATNKLDKINGGE